MPAVPRLSFAATNLPHDAKRLLDQLSVATTTLNKSCVIGDTVQLFVGGKQPGQWSQLLFTVPDDWQAPSYQNGFASYSSINPTFQDAHYRKSADGDVVIDGLMLTPNPLPAAGTVFFSLSAAYRPALNEGPFFCDGATAQWRFQAMSNGDLQYLSGGAVNTWVNVMCRFKASDRTPVQPSCYPIDLPYLLPTTPVAVLLAAAVDQANPASPSLLLGSSLVDWVVATVAGRNVIRIRNIPGLVPTKTYAVTLMAFGG